MTIQSIGDCIDCVFDSEACCPLRSVYLERDEKVRWIILTLFLGAVGLVAGLLLFGQIDGEKIMWSRDGLEGKVSWGGAGDLIGGQPISVWGTFVVGLAGGVAIWIVAGKRRRKKALSKVKTEKSELEEASDVQ